MKHFRRILSLLMVTVLLAGFMLVPGQAAALQPGDINGDGKINVGDVSRLYSHIRGVRLITDPDALQRADVTGDGKINIGDTARVYGLARSPAPSKTDVTLKVWAPSNDLVEGGWMEQMQESFEKAHPEYNITWINEVCHEGDAGSFVTDDPEGAADVYMFANDQLGMLITAGALTRLEGSLEAQVKNDNAQTVINTVTHTDGNIYGLPIANNTWFLYYNKDIFTEEDVKSLDTMLAKGKVAFPWSIAWYSGTFFLANGGQIFGEQGNDASAGIQFGADNGGYEAALKMVQLANHPNMLNDENGLGSAGMREGTVDAFFSGSWDYDWLYEGLGDKLGAVQPPMVEIGGEQKQMLAFAGSKAVGINPHSSNPTAAGEFAAFLASGDSQMARYELSGVIPVAMSLGDDPAVASNPVAIAEHNTMNNASAVQPIIPEMSYYWSPMGDFGAMVANGEITEDNYREQVDQLMYWLNTDGDYEPEDPTEPTPPEGETAITLKVWAPYEDQYDEQSWLRQMQQSFEEVHPEYDITWVNEECTEGDAGYMVSNDPEAAADVYLFANDQIGTLRDACALMTLEEEYLGQVLWDNSQTVINTVTYSDGQVYGFPLSSTTWFMYYNKDIFSEEDVKSLDTMLTKGKVAFSWGVGWYGGTFFLANGGTIFGEDGNDASDGIAFGADNGGYEAAYKMMELAANPNLLDDVDGLGWSEMVNGNLGAYFSGSWDYESLKEALGDKLGAVQLPMVEIGGEQKQMKSFAGSKAVGVNPWCDNPNIALEFAAHLASTESQKLRFELRGVIPAAEELANDSDVQENPVAVAEINTMSNTSVVQPIIPEMSNYWTPVGAFGGMVAEGYITEDNYMEEVDWMMEQLNDYEVYEPEDPWYPGYSDIIYPPSDDGIPVTLNVWAPAEDQTYDENWLVEREMEFQQEHPEYSITWINQVCGEGDAGYTVSVDPEAAADVYLFANDQIGILTDAGALTPLEGEHLDQVLTDNSQTLVNTVTYTDDQVYGFPVTSNTWFMYYNKDFFSEEDVKSLDTMLTKGTVSFDWGNAWYGGTFFLANGGELFGEKGNDASAGIQFGKDNGGDEAALKMVQLAANPNMVEYDWGEGFRDGSVGAYFSGSWDYYGLYEVLGDKLGVVQLPTVEIGGEQKQMKAFAGSKAVGVNPWCDDPEIALDFAAYLASVESQKLRYEYRGVIPAAKVLADDPEIAANPVAVAEINTMSNTSVVQPIIPEMSNYWTPVGNFGGAIASGEVNESNYREYVDRMMAQFGNIETSEEYVVDAVNYEKDVIVYPPYADFWDPAGMKHSVRIPEITQNTVAAQAFNQKIYDNHCVGYELLIADQEEYLLIGCDYEYKVYNDIVAIAVYDEYGVQAGGYGVYYETYYFDLNEDRELSFEEYLAAVDIDYDTVVSRIMQTPEYKQEAEFAWEPIVDMIACLLDENSTTAFFVNEETMDGWCVFRVESVLDAN